MKCSQETTVHIFSNVTDVTGNLRLTNHAIFGFCILDNYLLEQPVAITTGALETWNLMKTVLIVRAVSRQIIPVGLIHSRTATSGPSNVPDYRKFIAVRC